MYFKLIHEKEFCRKILGDFGVDVQGGLIVNGHVPVKLKKGESPIKASRHAITIDGAFSEVYGDKGFTLVLDADRTYLAQHHHFESISEAITQGSDIIPKIHAMCVFDPPRRVADTEEGESLRQEIARSNCSSAPMRTTLFPNECQALASRLGPEFKTLLRTRNF